MCAPFVRSNLICSASAGPGLLGTTERGTDGPPKNRRGAGGRGWTPLRYFSPTPETTSAVVYRELRGAVASGGERVVVDEPAGAVPLRGRYARGLSW